MNGQEFPEREGCENIAIHYSDKCDRLGKAINDAIELMDDEPAKKILEQALKAPAASERSK